MWVSDPYARLTQMRFLWCDVPPPSFSPLITHHTDTHATQRHHTTVMSTTPTTTRSSPFHCKSTQHSICTVEPTVTITGHRTAPKRVASSSVLTPESSLLFCSHSDDKPTLSGHRHAYSTAYLDDVKSFVSLLGAQLAPNEITVAVDFVTRKQHVVGCPAKLASDTYNKLTLAEKANMWTTHIRVDQVDSPCACELWVVPSVAEVMHGISLFDLHNAHHPILQHAASLRRTFKSRPIHVHAYDKAALMGDGWQLWDDTANVPNHHMLEPASDMRLSELQHALQGITSSFMIRSAFFSVSSQSNSAAGSDCDASPPSSSASVPIRSPLPLLSPHAPRSRIMSYWMRAVMWYITTIWVRATDDQREDIDSYLWTELLATLSLREKLAGCTTVGSDTLPFAARCLLHRVGVLYLAALPIITDDLVKNALGLITATGREPTEEEREAITDEYEEVTLDTHCFLSGPIQSLAATAQEQIAHSTPYILGDRLYLPYECRIFALPLALPTTGAD